MGNALDIARGYTSTGWRVVPIAHRTKRPPDHLAQWQELRLSVADLPRFFNGAPQNVGVLLGDPSGGLVDVDLDCEEAIALAPDVLPSTPVTFGRASKPRSHYLYMAPGAELERFNVTVVEGGQRKRRTIVELRSTGGQTVFPGSTHESGELVEWSPDVPDGAELGDVVAQVPAAELREAVVRLAAAVLLVRDGKPANVAVSLVRSSLRDVGGTAGVNVRRWLGIEEIRPPSAPRTTSSQSEDLDDAVARWNSDHRREWPRNSAPCPVCGDHASFGRLPQAPQRWSCHSTDHPEDVGLEGSSCFHGDALDLEAFQRRRTRIDVLRDDGYLAAKKATTTPPPPGGQPAKEPARRTLTIDARSFVGDDEPEDEDTHSPEDWVIPALVPRAGVTILGGLPKIGKTWVLLDMAVAVSTGQPLCGHWPVFQGTVFALLEEDTRRRIQRRLWRLARGRGLDPRTFDRLRLTTMSGFRLDREDMLAALEAEIALHRPVLVLIDALARVHGADENDRTGMRAVTVPLQDLCARYGVAIVLVHHFRKVGKEDENRSSGELLRGSGDLWALSRSVIGVKRAKDVPGLVVDAAGNDGEVPASTILIENAKNDHGKPTVRLVHKGLTADAHVAEDAKAALLQIRSAMPVGLGTVDLRRAMRAEFKGIGNERVDAAADYLADQGTIYRSSLRGQWRVQEGM